VDIGFDYGGSSVFNGRFEEIIIVSQLVMSGKTYDDIRTAVLTDNILGIKTASYREKVWNHIMNMWFKYPWWYVRFISSVMASHLPESDKRLFAYRIFLRRTGVLREIAIRFLRNKRIVGDTSFTTDELKAFMYRTFSKFRALSDSMQLKSARKALTFFAGVGYVSTGKKRYIYTLDISKKLAVLITYDWYFMEKRKSLEKSLYVYLLVDTEIQDILSSVVSSPYVDNAFKPTIDKELIVDALLGEGLMNYE